MVIFAPYNRVMVKAAKCATEGIEFAEQTQVRCMVPRVRRMVQQLQYEQSAILKFLTRLCAV